MVSRLHDKSTIRHGRGSKPPRLNRILAATSGTNDAGPDAGLDANAHRHGIANNFDGIGGSHWDTLADLDGADSLDGSNASVYCCGRVNGSGSNGSNVGAVGLDGGIHCCCGAGGSGSSDANGANSFDANTH